MEVEDIFDFVLIGNVVNCECRAWSNVVTEVNKEICPGDTVELVVIDLALVL